MLKSTLASLVLATSLVACADKPAPQVIAVQSPTDIVRPGQMVVTGTATLEVSPDCADLTMTLVSDGGKPGIATAGVQAKQEALIAALTKVGVETSDMKLSYMTLNPIYEHTPAGWQTQKIRTYRSEITITVTTKKFDKIAAIMEAGAESGVSSMSTQFRRSDLAELKKKVREMALTAAKAKAKQTTDTLGISLGRVVSVAENQGGMMWSNYYFPRVANAMEVSNTAAVALGGSLQPLTLDVTIGFELASET